MSMHEVEENPLDVYLRADRMPHIWCPGCGLGIVTGAFIRAIQKSKIDPKLVSVVAGIGCTGRIPGYLNFDTFHTTHGRAIPFAIGLKIAKPDLHVFVISGDGDLFAIGGNHIIHAARRNVNITVICVNNFNYGMTGGQVGPTTPEDARTTTTPYGNIEPAFNLPYVMASAGAVYVARWTTLQPRKILDSILEAMQKDGFSFIEIISPCPTAYGRRNAQKDAMETMKIYQYKTRVKNGADPREADITLNGEILTGKFVDIEKTTYLDRVKVLIEKANKKGA